jgi:hypothetical protein
MHRYRDAIFYQKIKLMKSQKKKIIGAYVLFPGADNADEVENCIFRNQYKT